MEIAWEQEINNSFALLSILSPPTPDDIIGNTEYPLIWNMVETDMGDGNLGGIMVVYKWSLLTYKTTLVRNVCVFISDIYKYQYHIHCYSNIYFSWHVQYSCQYNLQQHAVVISLLIIARMQIIFCVLAHANSLCINKQMQLWHDIANSISVLWCVYCVGPGLK